MGWFTDNILGIDDSGGITGTTKKILDDVVGLDDSGGIVGSVSETLADLDDGVRSVLADDTVVAITTIVLASNPATAPFIPIFQGAVTASRGGDLKDVLTSAAKSYVAQQVGQEVGAAVEAEAGAASVAAEYGGNMGAEQAAQLYAQEAGLGTTSALVGSTFGRAFGSAAAAGVVGGDIQEAFIAGGIAGAVPQILMNVDGYQSLSTPAQDVIASSVGSALQGAELNGVEITKAYLASVARNAQVTTDAVNEASAEMGLTEDQQTFATTVVSSAISAAISGQPITESVAQTLAKNALMDLGDQLKEISKQSWDKLSGDYDAAEVATNNLQQQLNNQQAYIKERNTLANTINAQADRINNELIPWAEDGRAGYAEGRYGFEDANNTIEVTNAAIADYKANLTKLEGMDSEISGFADARAESLLAYTEAVENLAGTYEEFYVEFDPVFETVNRNIATSMDPQFDDAIYNEVYKDELLETGMTAAEHWLKVGQYNNYVTKAEDIDVAKQNEFNRILNEYADSEGISLAQHFIPRVNNYIKKTSLSDLRAIDGADGWDTIKSGLGITSTSSYFTPRKESTSRQLKLPELQEGEFAADYRLWYDNMGNLTYKNVADIPTMADKWSPTVGDNADVNYVGLTNYEIDTVDPTRINSLLDFIGTDVVFDKRELEKLGLPDDVIGALTPDVYEPEGMVIEIIIPNESEEPVLYYKDGEPVLDTNGNVVSLQDVVKSGLSVADQNTVRSEGDSYGKYLDLNPEKYLESAMKAYENGAYLDAATITAIETISTVAEGAKTLGIVDGDTDADSFARQVVGNSLRAGGGILESVNGMAIGVANYLAEEGVDPSTTPLGQFAKDLVGLGANVNTQEYKDAVKSMKTKIGEAKGFEDTALAIWQSFDQMPVEFLAEFVGVEAMQEIVPLLVGGTVGTASKGLALASGASKKYANLIGLEAAIGSARATDVMEAFGATYADTYQESYNLLLGNGYAPEEAAQKAAEMAANSGVVAGSMSLLTMSVGGDLLEKSILGDAFKDTSKEAARNAIRELSSRAAKGAVVTVGEGVSEGIEEGVTQLFSEAQYYKLDPTRDISGNLAAASILGTIAGSSIAGGTYTAGQVYDAGKSVADKVILSNPSVTDYISNSLVLGDKSGIEKFAELSETGKKNLGFYTELLSTTTGLGYFDLVDTMIDINPSLEGKLITSDVIANNLLQREIDTRAEYGFPELTEQETTALLQGYKDKLYADDYYLSSTGRERTDPALEALIASTAQGAFVIDPSNENHVSDVIDNSGYQTYTYDATLPDGDSVTNYAPIFNFITEDKYNQWENIPNRKVENNIINLFDKEQSQKNLTIDLINTFESVGITPTINDVYQSIKNIIGTDAYLGASIGKQNLFTDKWNSLPGYLVTFFDSENPFISSTTSYNDAGTLTDTYTIQGIPQKVKDVITTLGGITDADGNSVFQNADFLTDAGMYLYDGINPNDRSKSESYAKQAALPILGLAMGDDVSFFDATIDTQLEALDFTFTDTASNFVTKILSGKADGTSYTVDEITTLANSDFAPYMDTINSLKTGEDVANSIRTLAKDAASQRIADLKGIELTEDTVSEISADPRFASYVNEFVRGLQTFAPGVNKFANSSANGVTLSGMNSLSSNRAYVDTTTLNDLESYFANYDSARARLLDLGIDYYKLDVDERAKVFPTASSYTVRKGLGTAGVDGSVSSADSLGGYSTAVLKDSAPYAIKNYMKTNYGFVPTDEQLASFSASFDGRLPTVSELGSVDQFIDSITVTPDEIRAVALEEGLTDITGYDETIQGNEDEILAQLRAEFDPQFTTEEEARQYFADLGFTPTDEQVLSAVGDTEENSNAKVVAAVDANRVTKEEVMAEFERLGFSANEPRFPTSKTGKSITEQLADQFVGDRNQEATFVEMMNFVAERQIDFDDVIEELGPEFDDPATYDFINDLLSKRLSTTDVGQLGNYSLTGEGDNKTLSFANTDDLKEFVDYAKSTAQNFVVTTDDIKAKLNDAGILDQYTDDDIAALKQRYSGFAGDRTYNSNSRSTYISKESIGDVPYGRVNNENYLPTDAGYFSDLDRFIEYARVRSPGYIREQLTNAGVKNVTDEMVQSVYEQVKVDPTITEKLPIYVNNLLAPIIADNTVTRADVDSFLEDKFARRTYAAQEENQLQKIVTALIGNDARVELEREMVDITKGITPSRVYYDILTNSGYTDQEVKAAFDTAFPRGVSEVRSDLEAAGYTSPDLYIVADELVNSNPTEEDIINYVTERTVTKEDIDFIAALEGISPEDTEQFYEQYVGQVADRKGKDPVLSSIQAILDNNAFTPEEIKAYFAERRYDATEEEIAQFAGYSGPQTNAKKAEIRQEISDYVDPRQLTYSDISSIFLEETGIGSMSDFQTAEEYQSFLALRDQLIDQYADAVQGDPDYITGLEADARQFIDQNYTTLDEAKQFFTDAGYDFTDEEVLSYIGGFNEDTQKTAINEYVDPRVVTEAEIRAIAEAEGITFEEAMAEAYIGQGTDADFQAQQEAAARAEFDPLATTLDEAKDFFASTGYTATAEEIAQFVASKAEEEQQSAIGAYVDPRQVTEAEASQFLQELGYTATPEEVVQFTGQVNDETFQSTTQTQVGEYVDPRMVSEDEARQFFADMGYTPTDEQVQEFIGQVSETEQADNISKYVDPRQVTVDEISAIAAQEGLTFEEAMAEAYIGQSESADFQTEQETAARAEFDPLATTLDEAQEFFASTGYTATPEELAQFVASKAEEEQQTAIGEYTAPRIVTETDAQQWFADLGYDATEEEIAQFVGQVNDETYKTQQQTALGEYVDPRMVTESEVRQAFADAGLANPTQSDVQALMGQYEQELLSGKINEALPNAQYNALYELVQQNINNQGGISDEELAAISNLIGKPTQDVNDTDIDFVTDLIAQQEVLTEPMTYTPEQLGYDVTGDGIIDSNDLLLMQQAQQGQEVEFAQDSKFAQPTGIYDTVQDVQTNLEQQLEQQSELQTERDLQQEQQLDQTRDYLTEGINVLGQTLGNVGTSTQNYLRKMELQNLIGQGFFDSSKVDVKTPDPAKIGYLYDFESIFANPQQAAMFPSPYAKGGYVDDDEDELYKLLGD